MNSRSCDGLAAEGPLVIYYLFDISIADLGFYRRDFLSMESMYTHCNL